MKKNSNIFINLAAAFLFFALTVSAIVIFLKLFAPKPYESSSRKLKNFDSSAMLKQLDPKTLGNQFVQISNMGSRSPGQPGHKKLAEFIRKSYKNAGLKVLLQEHYTPFPICEHPEILFDKQKTDVKIFPLPPNHLQPMVTPENGLTGKLVLVDDKLLNNAKDFSNMIALLDFSKPLPVSTGKMVNNYAALGFKAVLISHPKGISQLKWQSLKDMNMQIPVNYISAVADKSIFEYQNKDITIFLDTKFENISSVNIVGVLSPEGKSHKEAIIVPVSYDGFTMLPDLNMGSFNAMQVALQLQMLKAMQKYDINSFKRDVIFIATAGDMNARDSQNEILRTIGRIGDGKFRRKQLTDKLTENQNKIAQLKQILDSFENKLFCVDVNETEKELDSYDRDINDFFTEQFKYVLRSYVFRKSEKFVLAEAKFKEQLVPDLKSPEYKNFIDAKREFDNANELSSYPIDKLLVLVAQDKTPFENLRKELHDRMVQLLEYHLQMKKRLEQGLAINECLDSYDNLIVYAPAFAVDDELKDNEVISFSGGLDVEHDSAALAMRDIIQDAIFDLDLEGQVNIEFHGKKHGRNIAKNISYLPLHSKYWSTLSYPAFSILSMNGDYSNYSSPILIDYSSRLNSINRTLQVFGQAFLSLIYGNGRFEKLKYNTINDVSGYVYASGIGTSVVPNYPLENALLTRKMVNQNEKIFHNETGFTRINFFFTNPYGYYSKDMLLSSFASYKYSPEAALFNDDGLIYFYKDEGQIAQRIYKSMDLRSNKENVNIVLFRGTPVAILDRINPQNLKPYSNMSFISRQGLEEFPNHYSFNRPEGILAFIKPDERFFVELKSGSVDNEFVLTTRAFMLHIPPNFKGNKDKEIDGNGYLPMNNKIIYNVPYEIAKSMSFINNKRITLQKKYGMVDEMTDAFHDKAIENMHISSSNNLPYSVRNHAATESVIYNTLNHPVLRNSISEAITGVLWYMGLLVPFIFFFEKLVFGFTDIRKQLMAQVVIFLVVFMLLRFLHPAFQMIRSSFMILLGFVIMLISVGITVILSGKFKENIDALRKSQGHIKGAKVNTMGIMITAFMLGLNNMHRRKVRTALTCITLILLTFVMICFTSIQSDIVDSLAPVAKAGYQGILIKEDYFKPIGISEITALKKRYSEYYHINPRTTFVGAKDWRTQELQPPEIMLKVGDGDDAKSTELASGLLLSYTEPLQYQIKLLTSKGWFTKEQHDNTDAINPIIISDQTADDLGITPDDVNQNNIIVELNSKQFVLHGIFESSSLEHLLDLDGDNILPFDITALVSPKVYNNSVLADKEDIRIPAADVFIGLDNKFNANIIGGPRTISVAVDMSNTDFRTAKEEIDNYLEQSGKATYYGLDGIAYLGKRARESSMVGLIDMFIPLIIAAMTVLNTMKGSVYERRDEIYVYNAVGIAPKYVFFMFIAEAVVYSVVGALLGYILSQGIGRILMALGWTGGLNMNFTSMATVYASLTIAVAVFLSTIYPAKQAMKIAEPADEAGWKVPEPENNVISFELPFTYDHMERIAVIAFFYKYLINHGEGSSAHFFAGKPAVGIAPELDKLDNDGYIPQIEVPVWLKPFDLGVSQNMKIQFVTDKDTGEYISKITLTRLSGTLESWNRLNVRFIKKIRQHFLHWRAVSDEMKNELYEEAKTLIINEVERGEILNG